MDRTELLDKTFMYLYTMEDQYIFPAAFEKRIDTGKTSPVMLLDTIHDIGFAAKVKNTQQSLGANQDMYNYWLNEAGNTFIKDLPPDFTNRPFSYYMQEASSNKSLSLEKLNLELATLRNEVFDYGETERRSKNAVLWSAGATIIAALSLIILLLQWKCNRPD
jgi:hypothetical protein